MLDVAIGSIILSSSFCSTPKCVDRSDHPLIDPRISGVQEGVAQLLGLDGRSPGSVAACGCSSSLCYGRGLARYHDQWRDALTGEGGGSPRVPRGRGAVAAAAAAVSGGAASALTFDSPHVCKCAVLCALVRTLQKIGAGVGCRRRTAGRPHADPPPGSSRRDRQDQRGVQDDHGN